MARIIDDRSTSLDRTVQIFDSFYQTDLKVGASQFDIVHGYFTSVCGTKNIADNFTTVLFRISTQTGVDVLTLLDEIKGKNTNKLQMNQQICYWLNSLKSKTSLYGIAVIPQPVVPVARNVVL
jgi:hypothetical protein